MKRSYRMLALLLALVLALSLAGCGTRSKYKTYEALVDAYKAAFLASDGEAVSGLFLPEAAAGRTPAELDMYAGYYGSKLFDWELYQTLEVSPDEMAEYTAAFTQPVDIELMLDVQVDVYLSSGTVLYYDLYCAQVDGRWYIVAIA